MTVDTTLVNGRIIRPTGVQSMALTIDNGQVLPEVELDDVWRTVDASNFLVWPGMVQFGLPDGTQGSELARNGVTTVIVGTDTVDMGSTCLDFIPYPVTPSSGGPSPPHRVAPEDNSGIVTVSSSSELESARRTGTTTFEIPVVALLDGDPNLWASVADENLDLHLTNADEVTFPLLPFLYHEGHVRREISLPRLVEVTSAIPARRFGLIPQKGWIEPGSDGDLVVFDPDTQDPYREVNWPGRVILSLQRGNILFHTGQLHALPGDGQLLSSR